MRGASPAGGRSAEEPLSRSRPVRSPPATSPRSRPGSAHGRVSSPLPAVPLAASSLQVSLLRRHGHLMHGTVPPGRHQRRPSEAETSVSESPSKLQGAAGAEEAASSSSRRPQKASSGPLVRAVSANLAHRGSAAARTRTPVATSSSSTLEDQQAPIDERFEHLKQHAQATILESTAGTEDVVLVELPSPPGELTAYRAASARSRSPDRLVLDRQRLSRCPVLEGEDRLRLLSFQSNAITMIENLVGLPNLVFLDLYDNKIEQIENLEMVPSLRVLMLGKNQVAQIQNLDALTRLDVLDLHSNRISRIEKMHHLKELRVLNLAGNLIREVHNMEGLTSLTELNLRRNELASVAGVEVLSQLQRFFASHNQVTAFEGLEPLRALGQLSELALDGNPVCELQAYRQCLKTFCPGLSLLDQCDAAENASMEDKDGRTVSKPTSTQAAAAALASAVAAATAPAAAAAASTAPAAAAAAEAEVESSLKQQAAAPPGMRSADAEVDQTRPSNAFTTTRPPSAGPPSLLRGSTGGAHSVRHSVGAAAAGHRTGNYRASRPSSAGASRPAAQSEPVAAGAGSGERGRASEQRGRSGAAGGGGGGGQKLLSSHDVLREIRSQWMQAEAIGRIPTIRYGYVRREQPHELSVYGRGLEALDKPEYQSVITSIHFNFITMASVLQDIERLLKFKGLTSLAFSRNLLTCLSQIEALQQVPGLTSLSIAENPICKTRSALRIQALRILPGLRVFNGHEVTETQLEVAFQIFDPIERLAGLESIVPARQQRRKDYGPQQIVKIVDELTAHACGVDEKIREVHANFEAVVRDAIREVWDDVLSLEAIADGNREAGSRAFSPLDLGALQTRLMSPAQPSAQATAFGGADEASTDGNILP